MLGPGKRILDEPGRALVANSTVTLYTVQSVKRNVSTWVAVDGGMSDNLRPMLYGAVYEAQIADRFGGGTPSRLTGKHCESGDVIVRDVELADPRVGDVIVTPGDRRLRPRDGQQLQRRAAPAGRLRLAAATRASSCGARPTTTSPRAMSTERPSPSGSACSATAPSARAFETLLGERADHVAAITGLRPEISGVLTRSRGDFDEILAGCDLVVELIGGLEPGARLRPARDARRQATS